MLESADSYFVTVTNVSATVPNTNLLVKNKDSVLEIRKLPYMMTLHCSAIILYWKTNN